MLRFNPPALSADRPEAAPHAGLFFRYLVDCGEEFHLEGTKAVLFFIVKNIMKSQ
jgi:hypothetical protein